MRTDPLVDAAVYEQTSVQLVRFATGLVGPSDAADVVADAVVRVMTSPVWPNARNHRALLYRAVLFEAHMWRRSDGRRRLREHRAADLSTPEPPDFTPEVRAAVNALSPQQRAVVFLTYWEDLDPKAVGELLGVSDGSVRKQLARARKQLRKVLQ